MTGCYVALLALVLSDAADAQITSDQFRANGSRIEAPPLPGRPQSLDASPRAEARAALNAYAACLVANLPAYAAAFVKELPGRHRSEHDAQMLSVRACPRDPEIRYDDNALRGSLFVAMYKRDFVDQAPVISALPLDYADEIEGAQSALASRYVAVRQFGECVVRQEPVVSRSVVISPAGSIQESAAINDLKPALSRCLDQGAQVEMTKSSLTKLIAEVLYRLSVPIGSPRVQAAR